MPIRDHEILGVVAKRDQARRGGHDATPTLVPSVLEISPGEIQRIRIKGIDVTLADLTYTLDARCIVRSTLCEGSCVRMKDRTAFEGAEVKHMRGWVVTRRIPVRAAAVGWTDANALLVGDESGGNRSTVVVQAFGPILSVDKGFSEEEFSIGSVQDVEEPVTVSCDD